MPQVVLGGGAEGDYSGVPDGGSSPEGNRRQGATAGREGAEAAVGEVVERAAVEGGRSESEVEGFEVGACLGEELEVVVGERGRGVEVDEVKEPWEE